MAYTVNWLTKEVFVPVSDMVLVSGTEYRLDLESFRLELRRLEWEFTEGLWADDILDFTPQKIIAGNPLPPLYEVINDYRLILDPTAEKVSTVGGNNNLLDVQIPNGVSLSSTFLGSGGLTNRDLENIASAVWNKEICP